MLSSKEVKMARVRNLSKLTIDKDKIDTPSLHNALTAISDEENTKTDYLQLPHDDGTNKGVLGAIRFKNGKIETHNGINWSSLFTKTAVLHSVKGVIVYSYSTTLTATYDTDDTTNYLVFYVNGKEVHKETLTSKAGKNITATIQTPNVIKRLRTNTVITIHLETPQGFITRQSVVKTVKQAGIGGTTTNNDSVFTHLFTSDGSFYPRGSKYCTVHTVGGGASGGEGKVHIAGGGGGGGLFIGWVGTLSSECKISVGVGATGQGYNGGTTVFDAPEVNLSAGGGGGGASYDDDANQGYGGGGGGGCSDKYDPGFWQRTQNHTARKTSYGGTGGDGGWGNPSYGGGGGGGSVDGNDANNRLGGASTHSSLLGSVGGGGDGGNGDMNGAKGQGYGGGGGGARNGQYGDSGKAGAVAIRYTITD